MLKPYRGKEAIDGDWFVSNVLNCWLSIGDGERDLSALDLRKISLSELLKTEFSGTINIDGAWLSKDTLINDISHNRIIGIAFSHDSHTMAAVSMNGVVSVTNLLTQSQMIVGKLSEGSDADIGFNAEDYLIVEIGQNTYKWPTISICFIQEWALALNMINLIHFSGKVFRRVRVPGGMKPVPDGMRADFPHILKTDYCFSGYDMQWIMTEKCRIRHKQGEKRRTIFIGFSGKF